MTLYLNAHCGSIQLLIDVAHVLEVLDKNESATQRSLISHYSWREMILPVIDMPSYFCFQQVNAHRLVIIDSGMDDPALRFMALAVEKSEQLLSLDDASVVDMAQHNDALVPIFSGIYSPKDSSACQLVLRFPALSLSGIIENTGMVSA